MGHKENQKVALLLPSCPKDLGRADGEQKSRMSARMQKLAQRGGCGGRKQQLQPWPPRDSLRRAFPGVVHFLRSGQISSTCLEDESRRGSSLTPTDWGHKQDPLGQKGLPADTGSGVGQFNHSHEDCECTHRALQDLRTDHQKATGAVRIRPHSSSKIFPSPPARFNPNLKDQHQPGPRELLPLPFHIW